MSKLDEWMQQVRDIGFSVTKIFVDMLNHWRAAVLNCFVEWVNSGLAEDVSNRIKLILLGYPTGAHLRRGFYIGAARG